MLPGPGPATAWRSPSSAAGTTPQPGCEALDDDGGGFNALGEPNWTRIWIYDPSPTTVEPRLLGARAAAAECGVGRAVRDHRVAGRRPDAGRARQSHGRLRRPQDAGASRRRHARRRPDQPRLERLSTICCRISCATNGWITDKVEGVAVTQTGRTYVSTDNDGLDDWSGETWFFGLGRFWEIFD